MDSKALSGSGERLPALSVLTYSSLYPNALQPRHGIFIEQRLKHLRKEFPVSSRVVAPVPWFPSRASRFGLYAVYAAVPRSEVLGGVKVEHPRFPVVPSLSWPLAPALMFGATRGLVRRMHATHPIDIIDAHFFYPDGVAAVMLGRELGVPVCITARGSDITQMPDFAVPKRWIQWAAARAQGIVTVCAALAERLVELGVHDRRITVLRNGVDLDRFRPGDRTALRARLGLHGPVLLSVGNLIELKGHHLIIEAIRSDPALTLLIIGDGPEREKLEALARRHEVDQRVRFIGLVPQTELSDYYSASDALVLASSREGWANVLLESMACGTPVIATRVWGTPEVVASPDAGVLVDQRTPEAIYAAVRGLIDAPPERAATRRYAEQFSWEQTSRGQYELFTRLCATGR